MKILFLGDIVGSAGRDIVISNIKQLRKKLNIDCVIANAENSAHGFGITPKIYDQLISSGVDFITLGNHFFDQNIIAEYLETKDNIIRPMNYSDKLQGKGYGLLIINNIRVMVINLIGQLFMNGAIDSPFTTINNFLSDFSLKTNADIMIIDFHAETSSEKIALALLVDGKVSAVLGTHTHVPTNDCRILPKGTAFQTDVGMCGDYLSVIGMKFENSIMRFMANPNSNIKPRIEPATEAATIAATMITIDEKTGKATEILPIILGEYLKNTI
ncbi:TIGR00282 family metallophosphoesterase [Rickettsiales bacterium LUAb2]